MPAKPSANQTNEMSQNLRRDFNNREEMVAYLAKMFPETSDKKVAEMKGGRAEAERILSDIDPIQYEKSRNHLEGTVTHLSPYIRHGVLGLAEVKNAVQEKYPHGGKLVQELAWRDYFRRVYDQLGAGVWHDREPYKTGFATDNYADELPADIENGETGLACVDGFVRELHETGYLHNHARMWLAGYVVHWRRIKWQAGAYWFLQHLLDGDPASNNLSWQWVASTFSHKPYFYNRENVERFSGGKYCRHCPLYGNCDFEGSYPALEQKLFPHKVPTQQEKQKKPKDNRRKRWHHE
jgi:deoxyribodipyrimidine photo-lyase